MIGDGRPGQWAAEVEHDHRAHHRPGRAEQTRPHACPLGRSSGRALHLDPWGQARSPGGRSTANGMISRTGARRSASKYRRRAGRRTRVSPAQRPISWPSGWPSYGPRAAGTAEGNAEESLGPVHASPQVRGSIALPGRLDRHPDTEEATSSNLVPPTRQNAVLRASGFTPVRHPCVSSRVRAPLPRLDYAVVSVWGQVGIPLSRPVALVPEQIPNIHQRHPVHNQPARSSVPHHLRRKPAYPDLLTAGYQTRSRKFPSSTGPPPGAVNTSAFTGRPAIVADMPSMMPGGTGTVR